MTEAIELDTIKNVDCMEGLKDIPDKFVDLVIIDPPYELEPAGGGPFGSKNRTYHSELIPLSKGITNDTLDLILSKMKATNIYVWCNKHQLRQLIDYFDERGCNIDLLTWHKTNPVPTCANKYLSDTEYLIYAREKGVKLYGSYETKRKYYVTSANTDDKAKYGHPTIKPLQIIKNLVLNSSRGGGCRARCLHGFRDYGSGSEDAGSPLYRFRDRQGVLRNRNQEGFSVETGDPGGD